MSDSWWGWFLAGAVCIFEFLVTPIGIISVGVGVIGIAFVVNGLRLRKSRGGDKQD